MEKRTRKRELGRNDIGRLAVAGENIFGIFEDQVAEQIYFLRISAGDDATNGNGSDETRKSIELDGALLAIEEPIHVGVLDQFQERNAGAHVFETRCSGLGAARRKNVNEAEGKFMGGEMSLLAIKGEIAFLPDRGELRQGVWRVEELRDGIGPEIDARVAGNGVELAVGFAKRNDVFAEDWNSSESQGSGGGGFAITGIAAEGDGLASDVDGAGVE